MQTRLQRSERQAAVDRDHQFAIHHESLLGQASEHPNHVGKIAAERLSGFGPELSRLAIAPRERTKAIPFGLELPAIVTGKRLDKPGFHRDRYFRIVRHRDANERMRSAVPARGGTGKLSASSARAEPISATDTCSWGMPHPCFNAPNRRHSSRPTHRPSALPCARWVRDRGWSTSEDVTLVVDVEAAAQPTTQYEQGDYDA